MKDLKITISIDGLFLNDVNRVAESLISLLNNKNLTYLVSENSQDDKHHIRNIIRNIAAFSSTEPKSKLLLEASALSFNNILPNNADYNVIIHKNSYISSLANTFYEGNQLNYESTLQILNFATDKNDVDIVIIVAPITDKTTSNKHRGLLWEAQQRQALIIEPDIDNDKLTHIINEKLETYLKTSIEDTADTTPALDTQQHNDKNYIRFESTELNNFAITKLTQMSKNHNDILRRLTDHLERDTKNQHKNHIARYYAGLTMPAFVDSTTLFNLESTENHELKDGLRSIDSKYPPMPKQNIVLINYEPVIDNAALAPVIFEQTNLSYDDVVEYLAGVDYATKQQFLEIAISSRHSQQKLTSSMRYRFEALLDYDFTSFIKSVIGDQKVTSQHISPRFGYDVPSIIEEAELTEKYIDNFDNSLELYSEIGRLDSHTKAQLAVLRGHRIRSIIDLTLNDILSLKQRAGDQFYYIDKLQPFVDIIIEKHPICTEIIDY